MTNEPQEVELSVLDLRVVARYAADSALEVLAVFERDQPGDPRPRLAIEAALAFADGSARSNVQRTSAVAAHRAAKNATTEAAREAALAAGDAAAAAYLHPLARANQVRHILGASAHAAHAAELVANGDRDVGAEWIENARQRASPVLVAILSRYPRAPSSGNRATQLMSALDTSLRL
ncbi:MAG: putative immunity protein [Aeromicrobium sp.]